jgi:DNA-binding transcriptional LysR family regulator
LLNRSTRALHLTEAGTAFYHRAKAILDDVEDARLATSALNATPQGLLRITTPGAFGRRHVVPHIKEFSDLYPDIRLDISLTEATLDLIDAGVDVAIRIGALKNSTLVGRRFAPHRRLLVASKAYLDRRGRPATAADLAGHDCLLFALQPNDCWFHRAADAPSTKTQETRISGRFRADDSEAILQAARDGLGVALLPTWILAEDLQAGRLTVLMADQVWSIARGPEPAIWGVYPPKKTVSPKVRAFLDFVADRFGSPPYWEKAPA